MSRRQVFRGPLHAGTVDLHHYLENETVLGYAMSHGEPSAAQYLTWLRMKAKFFRAVEARMLPAARRAETFEADGDSLAEKLGHDALEMPAADAHVAWLDACGLSDAERERRRTGSIYVCAGSVFGAHVIRARILGMCPEWPVTAQAFTDRAAEVAYLEQLRQRGDCISEARACFLAMGEVCNSQGAR